MNANWIIDRIQDISFYSTDNCNKYGKLLQKELGDTNRILSREDRPIFELFALKIKYYTQSLNEEEEKQISELIDFFQKNK